MYFIIPNRQPSLRAVTNLSIIVIRILLRVIRSRVNNHGESNLFIGLVRAMNVKTLS